MEKKKVLVISGVIVIASLGLVGFAYAQDQGVPKPPTPIRQDGPMVTGGNLPSGVGGGSSAAVNVGTGDQGVPKPPTPVYTGPSSGVINNSTASKNATYEGGATIKPTVTKPAPKPTVVVTTKKNVVPVVPVKVRSVGTRQCIKNLHGGFFGAGRSLPSCNDGWGGNGQPKQTKLNNQNLGICRKVSNTGCSAR